MNWQADVAKFHLQFGVPISPRPQFPSDERCTLRMALIREECVDELLPAIERRDMVETADALVDTIYVLLGAALEFGIDLAPVWNEVHAANMRKVGGAMRADGKILKPDGWQPPDVGAVLRSLGLVG